MSFNLSMQSTRESIAMLFLPFAFLATLGDCQVMAQSTASDRSEVATEETGDFPILGRPYVRRTSRGMTVVGSKGELLRGTVLSVYKDRRIRIEESNGAIVDENLDPAYWDRLKAEGVNAVRLVFFDAWQRSHGNRDENFGRPYPFMPLLPEDVVVQGGAIEDADMIIAAEKAVLADELNRIVDLAAERRIYVMLNYHDTGGFEDPDWATGIPAGGNQFGYLAGSTRYLNAFWDFAVPLLQDRENIFFELMNESVPFHPNDYDELDIAAMVQLFTRVRSMAPQTHLVLASFTTTAHFGDRSMLVVTKELDNAGIDFSNASIGFHPYNISDLKHTPRWHRQVMRNYAVINTEQGYPIDVDDGVDDPDAPGFGRHVLGQQSMERDKISWFAWNTSGNDEFERNYLGVIQPDAIAKSYYWSWELDWADGLRDLQSIQNRFAQWLYRIFSRWFFLLTYF